MTKQSKKTGKVKKGWIVVDGNGFFWNYSYGKTNHPYIFLSLHSAKTNKEYSEDVWGIELTVVPVTISYTLPAKKPKK